MGEQNREMFYRWVEDMEPREPTPQLRAIWDGTRFLGATRREIVEPDFSMYAALYDEIGETLGRDEFGEWCIPDPQFWTPTEEMAASLAQLEVLSRTRYREVPNPDYDAEKEAAYWEKRKALLNRRRYEATPDPL